MNKNTIIGDFLVCKKVCVMYSGQKTTTVGKEYEVIDIQDNVIDLKDNPVDDIFYIIDDDGNEHYFFDDEYFYTKKESLNKKLKKIKNV